MGNYSSIGNYLSILVICWCLGGCTINIYHAPPSSNESSELLVIPQRPVQSGGEVNHQSNEPASNDASLADAAQMENSVSAATGGNTNLVGAKNVLLMKVIGSNAALSNGMSSIDNEVGSSRYDVIQFMDTVELDVQIRVDAYLNCYYQQANGSIIKIFPNRYSARYWVYAGQRIALPNDRRFQVVADNRGGSEAFMCLASDEDIMGRLPMKYRANMFQSLPIRDFDALYTLYQSASASNLVGRVVSYSIQ